MSRVGCDRCDVNAINESVCFVCGQPTELWGHILARRERTEQRRRWWQPRQKVTRYYDNDF